MKKPVYLLLVLVGVIISLSVAQISLANQISTTGSELVLLQKEIGSFKRDNMLMHEQLLEAESLTNISEKASKIGFVQAKSQISLSSPLPLAFNR